MYIDCSIVNVRVCLYFKVPCEDVAEPVENANDDDDDNDDGDDDDDYLTETGKTDDKDDVYMYMYIDCSIVN